MNEHPWVVLKFGGTSVATGACWQTIARIVAAHRREGLRPFVVCSALAGVSNAIERLLAEAIHGRHEPIVADIGEQHRRLADELAIPFEAAAGELAELARIASGAALVREVSPRLRAQAFATGELLSTRLGAAFLERAGESVAWRDARDLLQTHAGPAGNVARCYLSADCTHEDDPQLRDQLAALEAPVVLTQGFIARNEAGETVLLGRGGSDISAAAFAAKLGAARCEIWTDVTGMFTADPRRIPEARLLTHLDFEEAQELATSGAKVLHPRCLRPLRRAGIPLHIRCVGQPDAPHTIISTDAGAADAQVKAIAAKRGVTIVSMETVDMWHEVGFLAALFGHFQRHGLSVDLVSTSETNVTVTLDGTAHAFDERTIGALVRDLERFCRVRVIGPCAQVTLVGRNIRAILHKLGGALRVFEEQRIYLVTQAANDLNLSFVVDEEQADRLVAELHEELFGSVARRPAVDTEPTRGLPNTWWCERRDELMAIAENATPAYVYDERTLAAQIEKLRSIESVDRVFYSVKANPHPRILELVFEAGFGFECVSGAEVAHLFETLPEIDAQRILFTPNFVPRAEYEEAYARGVRVTLDNLEPLQAWPELFREREIIVRIDPGEGKGHHAYVKTAGAKSKFGVLPSQLDALARAAGQADARIVGLHAHVGSNVLDPTTWRETAGFLAGLAPALPDVRSIDCGGGFGVVEMPGGEELDIAAVDAALAEVRAAFPQYALWIEPGRYLVAECGVLLARVTQTKEKGDFRYVGVDAGMHTLIRPALYGSHHEIVNLTRLDDHPDTAVTVVGPICESGDVLGFDRALPAPRVGDLLLIATAGAYGSVMSSRYNLRAPAQEHFLSR